MESLELLNLGNAEYIERLYRQYQKDKSSVNGPWAAFFARFDRGATRPERSGVTPATGEPGAQRAEGVQDLVHSYRELGHFQAQLDPLGHDRPQHPLLDLREFGFSPDDRGARVGSGGFLGPTDGTLGDLVHKLQRTYCGRLGVEYMDISDKKQRAWLQERMEPILNHPAFAAVECRRILEQLTAADEFEQFLHAKYVGQKRFSLEGAESLIPLLNTLIEEGASLGADEVIMGMAHRGRLNVLAHVLHKPCEIIFSEFEGTSLPQEAEGDGDVKYHLGYSYDRVTSTGRKVHCSLSPNPSHLELVDPVIEGIVRAKQQYLGDAEHSRVVPILIHGEAAFTGQGIVPETLNLSELDDYRTGGTIHIIVNNQLGFTATARETRFTPYPTDVAKMIQAPIFHVNGDDPEAVVHAARLAIAFRQRFKVDVMIDLWSYRKYGHNEADDPTFTQPVMYREIAARPSVRALYAEHVARDGKVSAGDIEQIGSEIRERLDGALIFARELRPQQRVLTLGGVWKGMTRAGNDWDAHTAVHVDVLRLISERYAAVPRGFTRHPKLGRLTSARGDMAHGKKPVDWGCAEMWALGSLLLEGTPVRLAGQDTQRGTFSHRHAVLYDFQTGEPYVPLAHLREGQAPFTVVNTMLSELAVLGFEYGFSSADPRNLVLWEAQFGDFVNVAQPIIDQFISSAESKWQRMSGLVLLLPHGYEGQGPEHSSTRLERFLQLCGDNNMQICHPSLPAQYFHVLRRQIHRKFRKPLVLMSPKSLLRHDRSVSRLEDFSAGSFRYILDDPQVPDRARVRRLLFCSGKVYFTLEAAREEHAVEGIALVRVEQLYPFPQQDIQALLSRYRNAQEVCWVQEEPRNMGAWAFMAPRLRQLLPDTCVLSYYGRDEAASPATGSFRMHQIEEEEFVAHALDLAPSRTRAAEPAGARGEH